MVRPVAELEPTSIPPGNFVHKGNKFLTIHSKTKSVQPVEVVFAARPQQEPVALSLPELAVPLQQELQKMAQCRKYQKP